MKRIGIYMIVLTVALFGQLAGPYAYENRAQTSSLRSASITTGISNPGIPNLRLKGTLFTRGMQAVAIIEDINTGKVDMYEIGDSVGGLKISAISRGEVSFGDKGAAGALSLPEGAVIQPAADIMPMAGGDDWYKIECHGNTFILDEATIPNALSRAREIMKNLRIKPNLKDGTKAGLMIDRLDPAGILKDIGLIQGDVIKSVNGFKLNSPFQIFKAYKNLRNSQEIQVDIVRDNRPLILTYKINR